MLKNEILYKRFNQRKKFFQNFIQMQHFLLNIIISIVYKTEIFFYWNNFPPTLDIFLLTYVSMRLFNFLNKMNYFCKRYFITVGQNTSLTFGPRNFFFNLI